MLRSQLAQLVEEVLTKTKPSSVFTARVMAGIGAWTISLKAPSAVSAAGVGSTMAGAGTFAAAGAKGASTLVGIGATSGFIGGMDGTLQRAGLESQSMRRLEVWQSRKTLLLVDKLMRMSPILHKRKNIFDKFHCNGFWSGTSETPGPPMRSLSFLL